MADRTVDVVVQLGGADVLAGRLWSHRRRGSESATFAYAATYLAHRDAYELDPALPLVSGQQQTPPGRLLFGAFTDCAPDRWGRQLLQRNERIRVHDGGGAERSLGEIDYLLGVRDDLRQGALRFRDGDSGAYLAEERTGVPALVELPRLLGAADALARDTADDEDLRLLFRAGSSLGGARPKAHVLDRAGRLAIAKFPNPADDAWDVTRWEGVTLGLAREAGIAVPEATIEVVDGRAVLIVDRFDRRPAGRVGYASAMTMLEATDGERAGYLDIAELVERESPQASDDLRQLWRRVAFSILVSNTDDHLRNHGFLRDSSGGWSLSPAFDLNPDPRPGPKRLSTAIDFVTDAASVDALLRVAEHFRLGEGAALRVLREVSEATSEWRAAARTAGLDSSAIEQMAPAFEHEQAARARELVRTLGR
jgi:serine/threonine-protein kinase HipA